MMKFIVHFLLIIAVLLPSLPAYPIVTDLDRAEDRFTNVLADKNPGFESGSSLWTGTPTLVKVASGSNLLFGKGSVTWDSTAAAQTFSSASVTYPNGLLATNCEGAIVTQVPSGTATHKIQVLSGTDTYSVDIISTATPYRQVVTFPCPAASTTVRLRILSVAANEPLVAFDKAYIGEATNIGSIQPQAILLGGVTISGCNWSTTSSSLVDMTTTGCTYTPFGTAAAPGTMWPGLTLPTVPAGELMIVYSGAIGLYFATAGGTNQAVFQLWDGTNTSPEQLSFESTNAGTQNSSIAASVTTRMSYTTQQTNLTLRFRGALANGGTASQAAINKTNGFTSASGAIKVFYFPTASSQSVLQQNQQRIPNVRTYSSGSGMYTPTPGTTYIRARFVGGGGGGTGSSVLTSGGAGGNTTFGTGTATGGGGGQSTSAGTPGTGTLGTGWTGSVFPGGMGAVSMYSRSAEDVAGGAGGASMFGGGGSGGPYQAGSAAGYDGQAWGSGGGGGGNTNVSANYFGTGGSAGGGVDAIIGAPTATAYSIGAGGAAGTGNVTNGGQGKGGYLEITEYFGYTIAILANSVSTSTLNGERIERADFACSSSSSITRQSSNWSIANISSGSCVITFNTPWAAEPSCSFSVTNSGANAWASNIGTKSASSVSPFVYFIGTGNATAFTGSMICMGPR